jgi:hypothetical protein
MTRVLLGGLLAGILDLVYAFVLADMSGGTALGTLQSIASGLLGRDAYKGGVGTGALGLALHLAILVAAAGVYWFSARNSAFMRRHMWICGAAFGVFAYLFMNFVVLPLSAVPFHIKYTPMVILQGFISHALLVGLPIALCVRRS